MPISQEKEQESYGCKREEEKRLYRENKKNNLKGKTKNISVIFKFIKILNNVFKRLYLKE